MGGVQNPFKGKDPRTSVWSLLRSALLASRAYIIPFAFFFCKIANGGCEGRDVALCVQNKC